MIFKICFPFTDSISEINNTQVDNTLIDNRCWCSGVVFGNIMEMNKVTHLE